MKEALLGFFYGPGRRSSSACCSGQVPFLADVVGPYIKVFNAVPRIVLGSIFVVWLGFGTTSKVAARLRSGVLRGVLQRLPGCARGRPNLIANARVLGRSRLQTVRHVVLPSAVVWIIASLHVAFGFAIIGAIVGEFLGAQKGLGPGHRQRPEQLRPDGIFAAMLIIAVIALTAEWLIGLLEKRLLAWRPPYPSEAAGTLAADLPDPLTPPRRPPPLHPCRPSSITRRGDRTMAQTRARHMAGCAAAARRRSPRAAGPPRRLRRRRRRRRRAAAAALPTVKLMVGGIDKQIYLPYQLAAGARLLREVRRQRRAEHRAVRRRRRRGRDDLRPGRHGRRLVRAHDRLPAEGQGRHRRRPAERGPGRA